jgi:acetyltransferase
MITPQLIAPKSIVVVGGSEDVRKPGGKVLKNLIDHGYGGDLYVVHPKGGTVQGIRAYRDAEAVPEVDLAILAIPAALCPAAVATLAREKGTKAFIVLSAGFHEEGAAGAALEAEMVRTVDAAGACLVGPNCIGVLTPQYAGIFTAPVPALAPGGIDFITGSGATAVFILDAAVPCGLRFSSIFSVGNCAQTGVEEVLEYLDETYCEGVSARVKMLYVESIRSPRKLLRHASSLVRKGARLVAIKAGSSAAGGRAAASHTGALATPDAAVDALFRKAGIIRCYGRGELVTVAGILMQPLPKGRRVAIVTHAGGPAVMLADVLSNGGVEVPAIGGAGAEALLERLYPGSSVANPIDFLATGTAAQLGAIVDACNRDFENVDAMAVIFGSPGLVRVFDVYDVLSRKMATSAKPVYAILPTVVNSREEIAAFVGKGNVCFSDEVVFGAALAKVLDSSSGSGSRQWAVGSGQSAVGSGSGGDTGAVLLREAVAELQAVAASSGDGFVAPPTVLRMLRTVGIPCSNEAITGSVEEALATARSWGFPLVMKVVGPVHKSDVGGVALGVADEAAVRREFARLMGIREARGVLIQPMLRGRELYAGAQREGAFGHTIWCGLGGIFVEVLRDVSCGLTPLSHGEALGMIRRLRGYRILRGVRGQEAVDEARWADVLVRLSALCEAVPAIAEMDINPLLGTADAVVAVDARIRLDYESGIGN